MGSNPDHQVFPHATGAALETVDRHQRETNLTLWGSWFCPYVQRVWIALEEKGIEYTYHEVNPYKKEPEFLRVNPLGLVPAIELKNQATLWESAVLLEFLEDAYPGSPQLLPPTPVERARSRIWSDHISKKICPAFYSFLQAQEVQQIQANREVLLTHLKTFVKAMVPAEEGPYFFGERFTTVDIMVLPWVLRFSSVLKRYRDFQVPRSSEREDDKGIWERFAKWEDAALSRKSVQETTSDLERYIGVYKRYADNTTQSEVAKATRAGKALP